LGIIGLLSYVWVHPYILRASTKDATERDSPSPVTPPEVPARPRRISGIGGVPSASAAPATGMTIPASGSFLAASGSHPVPRITPSSKQALMQMALGVDSLPKKLLINILHAPTLEQSFSPHPSGITSPMPGVHSASATPPGAATLSEEKLAHHRELVQWELVSSEEKYIAGLRTLMLVYHDPCRVKCEKGSKKLTRADFGAIFSNIEAIAKLHAILLPALKTTHGGDVAAVMEAHADFLKM
jgi:hypothetical protein